MFCRALIGVILLLTAASGCSQEQKASREDYLDSKTVRWSDWVISQPISGVQGSSGGKSKSQLKGQGTGFGFLTPDESNYLVPDKPLHAPKSKKPRKSIANKPLGEDRPTVPAKKAYIPEGQPLQVAAPPPAAPVSTTQDPKEETKYLFAAAVFLLLQLVVVFLVLSLKHRLRRMISNLIDSEAKQSRETGPLQKQPADQDTLQAIQIRNAQALRAESNKNNALLLEIHRLKAAIVQESDAPLLEMESLKHQFVQEKNALMYEIRELQLHNDEFLRLEQEKNQDLAQEIEQLKATIASMTAAPEPELESVQDQYLIEKEFLPDEIRDPQLIDEKILREERENNLEPSMQMDRLKGAFSFITTAPNPSNSLIDDTVLENILSARTDGFMKR